MRGSIAVGSSSCLISTHLYAQNTQPYSLGHMEGICSMSEEHGADRNIPRLLRSVLTGFKPARMHKLRGHHVSCVATLSQEEGRCGVRQV